MEQDDKGGLSGVPLEDREIEWEDANGEKILIPAIDERWCDSDVVFPKYYNFNFPDMCPVKTWLTMIEKLNEGITWLLKLEYHKFWSNLAFDHCNIHAALKSFLQACPRITEPDGIEKFFSQTNKDKGVPQAMILLYANVFRVMIRMSTFKEFSSNFMGAEYFGDLIYERSIYTIPRIIDLLCVYGDTNEKMVKKMVQSVILRQPKYLNDLRDHTMILIRRIFPRCEKEANAIAGEAIVESKGVNRRGKLEIKGTNQLIYYSCDMINSMEKMAKFITCATMIFYEEELCTRFPKFYTMVYKCMERSLDQRSDNKFAGSSLASLYGRLIWFEKMLVAFIRTLIDENIIRPLTGHKLPNGSRLEDDCKDSRLEEYFKIMTHIVEEAELFAAVYEDTFPLENDFQLFRTKGLEIDPVITEHLSKRYILAAKHVAQEAKNSLVNDEYLEGAPRIPEDKDQQCLTFLKEMLPNYDDAFLWGKEASDVQPDSTSQEKPRAKASTLHEISDSLLSMAVKPQPAETKKEEESLKNVEVAGPSWANETEESPVLKPLLKGKKHDTTWSDKDRREVNAMRQFYQERREETRTLEEEEEGYNEYEDEYDDTYDSNTQGAMDELERKVEGTEKAMFRPEGQVEFAEAMSMRNKDASRQQYGWEQRERDRLNGDDWGRDNPNRAENRTHESGDNWNNTRDNWDRGGQGRGPPGGRGRGRGYGEPRDRS